MNNRKNLTLVDRSFLAQKIIEGVLYRGVKSTYSYYDPRLKKQGRVETFKAIYRTILEAELNKKQP